MMNYEQLLENYHVPESTCRLFERYAMLLLQSSVNVTALTTIEDIITYHFADSLELGNALPLNSQAIIDVGSGGGLPGIPLKIAYPQCSMTLIEVVAKKRAFLRHVIDELQLTNISVEERDWRTFLRTSRAPADIVCARASLQPTELLRMFQPQYHYEQSLLVYWASAQWEPQGQEAQFMQSVHPYRVGERNRKLVIFKGPR